MNVRITASQVLEGRGGAPSTSHGHNRVKNACTECKRRKVKCDGSEPCYYCRWYKHPERCLYPRPAQRPALTRKCVLSLPLAAVPSRCDVFRQPADCCIYADLWILFGRDWKMLPMYSGASSLYLHWMSLFLCHGRHFLLCYIMPNLEQAAHSAVASHQEAPTFHLHTNPPRLSSTTSPSRI